jgi:hypothetical protein
MMDIGMSLVDVLYSRLYIQGQREYFENQTHLRLL